MHARNHFNKTKVIIFCYYLIIKLFKKHPVVLEINSKYCHW